MGFQSSLKGWGEETPIGRGTCLVLNHLSSSLDEANFDAAISQAKADGAPCEALDPKDIDAYRPLDFGRAARAVYLASEGWVSSRDFLGLLSAGLAKLPNLTVFQDSAISVKSRAASIVGVSLLNEGDLACGKVIVATGSRSSELIQSAYGGRAPVQMILSGTGTSLLLRTTQPEPRHVIRTPNRSFSCGLHVVPTSSGLYVGATNNINEVSSLEPPLSDVSFLIDCVIDQVDHTLEHAALKRINVGNRPVSLDTFPLVGPTSISGLILLTATYRDGFHLSPLLAESVLNWVTGKPESLALRLFRPERSPISVGSRDAAIAQAVAYYRAVGSEHKIRLPRVGWEEMHEEMLIDKVESLYREIDSDVVLHPDLFSVIDRNRKIMVPMVRKELNRRNCA